MATTKRKQAREFVDVPGYVRLDNYGRDGDGVRFLGTRTIASFGDLFDTRTDGNGRSVGGIMGTMLYTHSGETIKLVDVPLEDIAERIADAIAFEEYEEEDDDEDGKE
jgi:hypothetical protein